MNHSNSYISSRSSHQHENSRAAEIYSCPIYPEVKQNHEDVRPVCRMKLVPVEDISHHDYAYDKYQGYETNIFNLLDTKSFCGIIIN